MAKKQQSKHVETASVAEAVNKSELFLNKYKNVLIYTSLAIIVLIAAGFAYQKFYREPLREEALGQLFTAEQYFRADSFNLALNGDGNALGFKEILDEYGTAAGKAVYFYAGVSALQLGDYEEAIDFLNKYRGKDEIIQARAYCCIGDAYVGLNRLEEALSYFLKAASYKDNLYAAAYYKKAGILYEELDNNDKAIEMYQKIKDDYPASIEAYDIDKYISRLDSAK